MITIPKTCVQHFPGIKNSDYCWIVDPVQVTITGQEPTPKGPVEKTVKIICPMSQLPNIKHSVGLRNPTMFVTHLK